MKSAIKIFKALSDANRLRIVKMLETRSLCVCEITEVLKLAPSTVSKHLSILKEADLIIDMKNSKWVYYRLNKKDKNVKDYLKLVNAKVNDDQQLIDDNKIINSEKMKKLCEINLRAQ